MLFDLINLAKTQVFCIYKFTKFIIVNKNKDFVFVALQIMIPSLKSLNNNQKCLILSLIPSLNKDYFSKKNYFILLTNFKFKKKLNLGFCGSHTQKKIDPNNLKSSHFRPHSCHTSKH